MRFNLISDCWIPIRRRDGSTEVIPPYRIAEPDIVSLSIPRPDFSGAMLEFLISLIQTCAPPKDRKDRNRMLAGVSVDGMHENELREKLQPFEPYFNLFGQRPLFLQDLTLTTKEAGAPYSVDGLVIDQSVGNAVVNNTDFFIRRGNIATMCPACAAMALLTLQTYAPAGGVGNRTSVRGGGPLTTLVDHPDYGLWQSVVANTQPLDRKSDFGSDAFEPKDVFPWLNPTLDSTKKTDIVFPTDRHPLEAIWGMPRRIRLIPEEFEGEQECDVCSLRTTTVVRQYYAKNYGNNYHETWSHPFSPYRSQGPGKGEFPIKGMADGTGYSQWLGIVYGDGNASKPVSPAKCIKAFKKLDKRARINVHAFGYAMDNAKALMWCEGTYPVFDIEADQLGDFRKVVEKLVTTATKARDNLMVALKTALFSDGGRNAKATQTLLSNISKQFWADTETQFYAIAEQCSKSADDEDEIRKHYAVWLDVVLKAVLNLFDRTAEAEKIETDPRKLQQVCEARSKLAAFTIGSGRKVLELPKKTEKA